LPHCCESGVEIAQRLFWQKKMHGAFHTPAKFIPVWKSFSDVVPSPNHVTATRSSLRICIARAAPAACTICVPSGELIESQLISASE
jgi:hypothetical protein